MGTKWIMRKADKMGSKRIKWEQSGQNDNKADEMRTKRTKWEQSG